MTPIRFALAAVVSSGLAASVLAADVVTLKNGKQLEGRVVRDTQREVVVRVGSRDRTEPAENVAGVSSAARKVKEVLAIWERLAPADVGAVRELASQCESLGLKGEARVFALFGLGFAPQDGELHRMAGHEKRGETWHVRTGSKRESFEKRCARDLDWGEAWELETTHFLLRSNLPLRDAVLSSIELELGYRAFFAWFAEELPLYEPGAVMKACVYASSAEFPEATGRSAYFQPTTNVLHVDAHAGLDLWTLTHEMTHEILFNTSSNTKASLGAIPAWLDEGLSEYMAACREGEAGRAAYSRGRVEPSHFARHRAADDPYSLNRMLSMSTGDFSASSNAALKYSQSYTLVHFGLHGGPDGQRARFVDYIRRAYAGKSSMTEFKDALEVKGPEFEAAWIEYVRNEG